MKAGLMEIADIFVVNKCDREGADRFTADLQSAMHLKQASDWTPPVVQTAATLEKGIDELHIQVERHREFLQEKKIFEERRLERTRRRIEHIVESQVLSDFWTDTRISEMKKAIQNHVSPYEISRKLLSQS
jgi:LAO/AO transport system kinase